MHFHRFFQGANARDKAVAGAVGLSVVLGLALFLRSAYLVWGIPGAYRIDTIPSLGFHPDEPVLMNQIRELLEDPRQFSVFTYPPLQAQFTAVLAKISGTHTTIGLYLLARWISVLASLLTVWFAWLIGSLWGRFMGLTAAAFMAFTMEACHQAHWANPESLCTLGIVAGAWFCLRGPGMRNLFLASLCIGLSICAKYFGILFLHLPLAAAYCRGDSIRTIIREWRRYLLFYIMIVGVVAVDLGYYLWSRFDRFAEFFQTNSLWAHGRGLFGIHPAPVLPPSYTFSVLPFDLGLPIYGLAILGLLLTIVRNRQYLVLLLIPLPFWIFLETLNYKPPRFSLHLLPFLVLLAAIPATLLWRRGRPPGKSLAAAICLLVAGYSFAYSFSFIRCLDKNRDPRVRMERWVRSVGDQPVAILGFDEIHGRYGLCRYRHSIGLSGIPLGKSPYRYLVVPDIIHEVLEQWSRLDAEGYRYTKDDWWPMQPPAPELLGLIRDLQRDGLFRRVLVFENKPELWGIRMEVVRIPFSYFWISNLSLEVLEKAEGGKPENPRNLSNANQSGSPK